MTSNKKKKSRPRPGPNARPKPKAKPAGVESPEGRKPTREERWEATRRARQRQRKTRQAVAAVVALVLLGGLVAWQVGSRRDEARAISTMEAGGCDFDRKSDPGRVNEHADNVSFQIDPPSGGVHEPTAASPGVFDGGTTPPRDGQLVHAMEHGDIVFWYGSGLPSDDLAKLQDLVESRPDDLFLVERSALSGGVAVTAWHKRLVCEAVDLDAFKLFVRRYADKGPEQQRDALAPGGYSPQPGRNA